MPPDEAVSPLFHSLRGTARALAEDTINLRRALAWARTLPGVDPDRAGLLGVSRGAIVTALVAQAEPDLSTVLVLGGGDLAGLLRDSRMAAVERMRRREIERAGGDPGEAAARATAILRTVDPASRPERIDPARTLLIQARWDHVVPRGQAEALRAAAGGAPRVWLPAGHTTSLLFSGRVGRKAREHFRRTLR
jgi:fermentation-respiration switch protein FrsA (DUF1100 family)